MSAHRQQTESPQQTVALAAALAATLKPGAVLALHGDLGAGKTCFVRGLAQGLGVVDTVSSPTFTLVNEYRGPQPLIHVDLYRIEDALEAEDFGLEDYFDSDAVTVVEWPGRAEALFPARTLHVYFTWIDEARRLISWEDGL